MFTSQLKQLTHKRSSSTSEIFIPLQLAKGDYFCLTDRLKARATHDFPK